MCNQIIDCFTFQSTLPLRGATRVPGGRHAPALISIHAPLAGSDRVHIRHCAAIPISIHAPLAGSDVTARTSPSACRYFNPRSPCGERPELLWLHHKGEVFQSTLPLRGATAQGLQLRQPLVISIHAPLAGSDLWGPACPRDRRHFNPRSPCGERHRVSERSGQQWHFNPRSPCGERRCGGHGPVGNHSISIHAPLAGSDRSVPPSWTTCANFNPRSPCGERQQMFTKIFAVFSRYDEFFVCSYLLTAGFLPKPDFSENSAQIWPLSTVRTSLENDVRLRFAPAFPATGSVRPPAGRTRLFRSAESSSHSAHPVHRSVGCPFPDP